MLKSRLLESRLDGLIADPLFDTISRFATYDAIQSASKLDAYLKVAGQVLKGQKVTMISLDHVVDVCNGAKQTVSLVGDSIGSIKRKCFGGILKF